MYVYADVAKGDSLRLGIRADARRRDGTRHPEYKNGWFKVDYCRIFLVIDKLRGDVNADGQVGIGDIVAITNYMAGGTDYSLERCDVNGDG